MRWDSVLKMCIVHFKRRNKTKWLPSTFLFSVKSVLFHLLLSLANHFCPPPTSNAIFPASRISYIEQLHTSSPFSSPKL